MFRRGTAVLCQIIKDGVPDGRYKRKLQREACLLLAEINLITFPVNRIQRETCDIAAPDTCKDEQEHDSFVTQ